MIEVVGYFTSNLLIDTTTRTFSILLVRDWSRWFEESARGPTTFYVGRPTADSFSKVPHDVPLFFVLFLLHLIRDVITDMLVYETQPRSTLSSALSVPYRTPRLRPRPPPSPRYV